MGCIHYEQLFVPTQILLFGWFCICLVELQNFILYSNILDGFGWLGLFVYFFGSLYGRYTTTFERCYFFRVCDANSHICLKLNGIVV